MTLLKGRTFAELESPFLDEEILGETAVTLPVEAPSTEEEERGEDDEGPGFSEECELESDEEAESALRARALEWELADLPAGAGPVTEQQVPPGATVDAYGSYNLRAGNAAVRFWPLAPGRTVATATPVPPPPGGAIRFAVVDVLIRVTSDPRVLGAVPVPNLLAQVAAPAAAQSMPLVPDANGDSRICFGVPLAAGAGHFSGTLRLEIRRGPAAPAATINVDLPLRVAAGATVNNLVVFFVVQPGFPRRYAWMQLRAQAEAAPNAAIAGAAVQLNLLRDHSSGPRTQGRNRRIALTTGATGFVGSGGRDVIGVPIGWPLLFKATAQNFAPRGHLVRLAAAQISNNLAPFVAAPAMRMLRSNVNLGARRIMLDAGHGVVYALTTARRSQEWFVNHKIVDRVSEILRDRHGVNAANILLTRTAGFGMIEPAQLNVDNAPERGAGRFAFDLARRRVRIRNNAITLRTLSDLLLTLHGAANAAQPVAAADRNRLVAINAATVATISQRLAANLSANQRVRAGSVRWDAATARYVFTVETTAGAEVGVRLFSITDADWWNLDDAMMDVLIDRSARWSLLREIGRIAAQHQIPGHDFIAAARTAMQGAGALDYMRGKIRFYLPPVPAPAPPAPAHPWAVGGTMGWRNERRVEFFNAEACDLYISVHANAFAGVGTKSLVSRAQAGADVPPDDQIRLAKITLKYLDPFDQGLHGEGITRENPGFATPPLQSGNTRRGNYLYLETEFMDARNPDNPNQYRYEQMVEPVYIDRVAEQIVAAALEILLAPQGGLDAVRMNNTFALW